MTRNEARIEETAERVVGRAVIEAMRRSGKAREMAKKLVGEEIDMDRDYNIPTADVMDTEEELVVIINLPGTEKEKIDLRATEDSLFVEAPSTGREGKYLRQERPAVMKRTLKLPVEIKPEQVKARYENGVLEVRLPKLVVQIKQKVMIE
ncbi:MAG: Hsp20/alpha crystallin family protein [Methanosarcinales archaeon]|nr:Hsp20/alpha crystallin family protein [Methanosarcinales archaeon]